MKRSLSNSNIPLPHNSRTSASGLPRPSRSRSFSRFSRDNPISHGRRNSSQDRKTSISKLTTPLNKVHLNVPSSGSCTRASPGSAFKDKVNVQKLVSDKKWVAREFAKVQNFIETSGLFDLSVVNANNIKPPSIKCFVYVSKALLEQFFTDLKIEAANYKEIIINKMKVLQYPSTIPNSVLKTVNTMHSWPQIIAMWAWLIDKIALISQDGDGNISLTNMNEDERENYLKIELCREYILKKYDMFNNNRSDPQVDTNFYQSFCNIMQVDPEEAKKLESELMNLEKYRENQEAELLEIKRNNDEKKERIKVLREKIAAARDQDALTESELRESLEKLTERKQKILAQIESVKVENEERKVAIHRQNCTSDMKRQLLMKVEELKRDVKSKENRIKIGQEMRRSFDEQIGNETGQIHELVHEWNCQILPISIKEPRFKKLLLREKAFYRKEFLEEIMTVKSNKKVLDDAVSAEITSTDQEIAELEEQISKKEALIKSNDTKLSEIKLKTKDLMESNTTLRQEMREMINAWIKEEHELLNERDSLRNSKEVEELHKQLVIIQEKVDTSVEELNKLKLKSLAFSVEQYKEAKTVTKKLSGVIDTVEGKLKEFVNKKIENQNKVIEALENLPRLEGEKQEDLKEK